MTSNQIINIDLQVDNGKIKTAQKTVTDTMTGLQLTANNMGMAINTAFAPDPTGIQNMVIGMNTLTATIAMVTVELQNLCMLLATPMEGAAWSGWYADAADSLILMLTLYQTYLALAGAAEGTTAAFIAQAGATQVLNAVHTVGRAVSTAFGAAMSFLTSPIGLVVVAITALIAIVVLLVKNWDTVKETAQKVWVAVQESFAVFDGFLQNIFAKDFTEQFGAIGSVINAFMANAENMWNAVKTIFGGIIDFVKNIFKGEWGAAWDGIVKIFQGIWDGIVAVAKAPINAIIGIINGLIAGVIAGINGVIGMLNKLNFKIPDWVPGLGGKSFGFNLKTVTAPQIPYLAQGAVLPANRPFLAMVGDQRHGTNVEAPLATIQEAVAVVLNEQLATMMSGFRAVVEEQRATRATIENIEVGDTVIGQAARRYNTRMAIAGIW